MKKLAILGLFGVLGLCNIANAAGLDTAGFTQGERNYFAIGMFVMFVAVTLGITYFSSKVSKTSQGFYTADRKSVV